LRNILGLSSTGVSYRLRLLLLHILILNLSFIFQFVHLSGLLIILSLGFLRLTSEILVLLSYSIVLILNRSVSLHLLAIIFNPLQVLLMICSFLSLHQNVLLEVELIIILLLFLVILQINYVFLYNLLVISTLLKLSLLFRVLIFSLLRENLDKLGGFVQMPQLLIEVGLN